MSLQGRRWGVRVLGPAVVGVVAGALCTAPAQASLDITPPNVNFSSGLLFKVGTALSDSSTHPTIPATLTWTAYDDVGVISQSGEVDFDHLLEPTLSATTRRFTFRVPLDTTAASVGSEDVVATDAAGNAGSDYDEPFIDFHEEGEMTASAGWSTATCPCWSAGALYRSTRAGASLQYRFYAASVAVIGDKAPGRGDLQVYIDGKLQSTVGTAGSQANRIVVYQRRFGANGTHTLKLVAATSARVDVDALITEQSSY